MTAARRSSERVLRASALVSALLVMGVMGGCRDKPETGHQLPYRYVIKIDAKRVWVDVAVNGLTVVRFPETGDRTFGDYFSERTSEDITAWVRPGANEVVFRVVPADDSGTQHRELELRRLLRPGHRREELFSSESRDLGEIRADFVHDVVSARPCEPLSEQEIQEIIGRVHGLHDAVVAGDFEKYRSFFPRDDEVVEFVGPLVEQSWSVSEGQPPTITPVQVDELEVQRRCDAEAVFVTSKKGGDLFHYEFVSPDGRVRSRNVFHSAAFRQVDGAWMMIH